MRKERQHFTPEERVAILRRHLVDKVPVSELCEELGLRPTLFYRWQKELFENEPALFSLKGVATAKWRRSRKGSSSSRRTCRPWTRSWLS
jgi:transposase